MTLKNTDNPWIPRLKLSSKCHANTSCWQMWRHHKHFKVPTLRPSPCTDANCKKCRTYGLENIRALKQRLGRLFVVGEHIFITHHLVLLRENCDKDLQKPSLQSKADRSKQIWVPWYHAGLNEAICSVKAHVHVWGKEIVRVNVKCHTRQRLSYTWAL